MNDHLIRERETLASSIEGESEFDAAIFDTAIKDCFEKLDKLVMRLHRYPLEAAGAAMGMYLQELLGFSLEERQCSPEEVREFLSEIESGVLHAQGSAGT